MDQQRASRNQTLLAPQFISIWRQLNLVNGAHSGCIEMSITFNILGLPANGYPANQQYLFKTRNK